MFAFKSILIFMTLLFQDAPIEQATWLKDFDGMAEASMASWQVPGLAAGAIQAGEVVLAKGYGFADLDASRPVDRQTVFPIGSITKSFTASILGEMVAAGKVDWHTPIQREMPDFRLQNSQATMAATLEDMLGHRAGLARHDAIWMCDAYDREAIFKKLQYLEPAFEFREQFHYSNLNYLVAGRLAEHLSGKTWEALVSEKLLTPLNMTRTWPNLEQAGKAATLARPYTIENDRLERVKAMPYEIRNIAPAGAIASCIDDMLVWLRFQFSDEPQLQAIPAEILHRLQTPTTLMPYFPDDDQRGFVGAGMGWFVEWYRGHYLVFHSGVVRGYSAWLGFLPHQKTGVVILSNRFGNPAPQILGRYALDRMLDVPPIDWQSKFENADGENHLHKTETLPKGAPSLPLAHYSGRFSHPAYGTLTITSDEQGLGLEVIGYPFRLEHLLGDHFTPKPVGGHQIELPALSFQVTENGEVTQVQMVLDPAVKPIEFCKDIQD